jgi:hypothetical protein
MATKKKTPKASAASALPQPVTKGDVETSVESVVTWLYGDSHIRCNDDDKRRIREAIEADLERMNTVPPTDAEIEELVTGGDEGEPSKDLTRAWKKLNRVIQGFFGGDGSERGHVVIKS